MDGHDSHERHSVLSMARKKNIIIVRFPSHCTHLMQPLDLSYFKPFKAAFVKAMEDIIAGYGDRSKTITAKDFVGAVKVATDKMAKQGVIKQGFKAMGMTANEDGGIAVDSQAVPEFKLLGAERAVVTGNVDSSLIFDVDGKVVDLGNLDASGKAVLEAFRRYLVREGMTLPKAKLFKYQNPTADELTTSPMLVSAVEKNRSRDERRHKKSRASLSAAAAACGATILIEGEDNGVVLPKPQDGFVDVGKDNAMKLIVISDVVSLEQLIVGAEDDNYEFWVTVRNVWHRVNELEVTKKYKKHDERVSELLCKLGGNSVEKKLGRSDLKVEGYGVSWVIFKKNE